MGAMQLLHISSLHRAKAVASVFCFSLCIALFINAFFQYAFEHDLTLTRQAQHVDLVQLSRIQQRLNKIAAQRRSTDQQSPKLAVVVGLSTAREGIDAVAYEKSLDARVRLLNLAASGGSMSELRAYTKPLLTSGLKPSIVYVMVHPSWLAGRTSSQDNPLKNVPVNNLSSIAKIQHYRAWFFDHIWLIRNRAHVQTKINETLLQARLFISGLFSANENLAAQQNARDPWAVQRNYAKDYAVSEFLSTQLSHWRTMNWFEAGNLLETSHEALQLRTVLQELLVVSDHVILVLMPEASGFRSLVPAAGEQSLLSIAHQADSRIKTWNFRQLLSDEKFYDLAHPNRFGRDLMTEKVAAESRSLLNK